MTAASPFRAFGGAICRDQQRAEALRAALERFAFDGTECHTVVDAELRGLELELARAAIRHIIVATYRGTVPIDAAIELVLLLRESGELA
jgi:hypothetical protein